MSDAKLSVSVIGLGAMGATLARTLITGGYRTTVWNRSPDKAAPLLQAGAQVADSVAGAAAASDVVVVSVLDYAVAHALLHTEDVARALHGKVLVQLTTGTAADARAGQAWAQRHGIRYLDGAIMSYPSGIGSAPATLLYAGPPAVFEAVLPLLKTLGGNTVHVGEPIGNASTLDNALLDFYYGACLALVHGATICQSEQIPLDAYIASLSAFMPVLDATGKLAGQMIQSGRFAGTDATLNVHTAALAQVARMARENQIDAAVPEFVLGYFRKVVAAGHGSDEIPALIHGFGPQGR